MRGKPWILAAATLILLTSTTACYNKTHVTGRGGSVYSPRYLSKNGTEQRIPGEGEDHSGSLSGRNGTGEPGGGSYGAYPPGGPNRLGATGKDGGTGGKGMTAQSLHANTRMQMNADLVKTVDGVDGIHSAIAAVTENQTYVALQLEPKAYKKENYTSSQQPVTGNGTLDSGSTTSGIAGNSYDYYNWGAIPGTVGRNHGGVPVAIREKVVKVVQSALPDLQHVFISADPNFYRLLGSYEERARQGLSLTEALPDFNAAAASFFPDTEGTGSYGGSSSGGTTTNKVGNSSGYLPGGATSAKQK